MRALPHAAAAFAVAAALLALPLAAAATFELPQGKIVERPLDPGHDAVFTVPLVVNQGGALYAKLLVTSDNAVNDGNHVNGSLEAGTGWRVGFAFVREDGTRLDLGAAVDSTPTALVPVKLGEKPTFEFTVHVPADAASGGPSQRVYAAIAYRLASGSDPGGASGATMDEARSVTLLLSNALLPPAQRSSASVPSAPSAPTPPPASGAAPSGSASASQDAAASSSGELPPVGFIPTTGAGAPGPAASIVVVEPGVPTWFLVVVAGLFVGILALLALATTFLALLWRGQRTPAPPPAHKQVPIDEAAHEPPRLIGPKG